MFVFAGSSSASVGLYPSRPSGITSVNCTHYLAAFSGNMIPFIPFRQLSDAPSSVNYGIFPSGLCSEEFALNELSGIALRPNYDLHRIAASGVEIICPRRA